MSDGTPGTVLGMSALITPAASCPAHRPIASQVRAARVRPVLANASVKAQSDSKSGRFAM